ncbi:hypothetical protein FXE69_09455, partial [Vibrio cholerae]
MTRKRRNHSPEFKAKVALDAAKGDNRVGGGITPAVLSHHRTSVDRIRRFRIDFQCFIPFQQ